MKYISLPTRAAWFADADGMVASDSSREGRRSFLDFYTVGRTLTKEAYRAGVPIMVGTDAGDSFVFPGSSVHDELAEFVAAGLSPADALRSATLSGAEYLGRRADLGTIAPGRFADLVLLDGNPLSDIANVRRIHAVILSGRAFDRRAIDSMLASVESAARPTAQVELWVGAAFGDTVAISAALDAGANIDSLDSSSMTPAARALDYAALFNRPSAVRLLLARGASINLGNKTGFTPVHHAVEAGAIGVLEILVEAGADLTIATNGGLTPLALARQRGNQAAVKLLESRAK